MARLATRPGFAAFVAGGAILLQLAAASLLLSADEREVYFAGSPLGAVCTFQRHFGAPCPSCGLTRGAVLALHADFGRAARLHPAAPLAVTGAAALACALLLLAALQRGCAAARAAKLTHWLRGGGVVYASLLCGVAAGAWLWRLTVRS